MSTPRNGRIEVYPAEVLANNDLLTAECFRMADVSCLAQAILGAGISNASLASGLACTPTSPPSFSVDIAPGTIYSYVEYDATPYPADGSGLPADTTDMLYKQGINLQKTVIPSLTAPVSGTLFYLIQAQLSTTDNFSTTRQYYNPDTPQTPITLSANSVRQDSVSFTVKSSSGGIPSPDSGFIGLWVVTVASTDTSITSGMIAQYSSGVSFINETLTQKISQATADARYMQVANFQIGDYIYGNDSGSANTYVLTLSPALGSLVAGTYVRVLIANTNTGSSTLNINGLGATNITLSNGASLFATAIVAGMIAEFIYNGTNFELQNPNLKVSGSTNGYQVLPGGMILQWGSLTIPASSTPSANASVTFPGSFGTAVYSITTSYANSPNGTSAALTTGAFSATTSGFTFQIDTAQVSSTITSNVLCYWQAIGI